MKSAFSLVEMLVVVGIIAILTGSSLAVYSNMTNKAQITKGQELVFNTTTALTQYFQEKGFWPDALVEGSGDRLDAKAAYPLAKAGYMSLSYDANMKSLSGLDRCGIVDPWAMDAIKSVSASSSADHLKVRTGGTVDDHILRYAIDDDGDGITEINTDGISTKVRATACVWSCGPDGVFQPYSKRGRSDDIYSWTKAMEVR